MQERNNYTPCVFGIEDFTSSFLFSVEVSRALGFHLDHPSHPLLPQIQHTIGFGYRGSTHKCRDAVLLQCLQSVLGVLLEAALTGVFFVKLSRPKRRNATVIFSKNAVSLAAADKAAADASRIQLDVIKNPVEGYFLFDFSCLMFCHKTYLRPQVVCLRNGQLRLMFRVANLLSSQLLEAHVRAQVPHATMDLTIVA